MTIGNSIRKARIKSGMTINTLSILTGLSERFLNYIEKNKKRPSLRSLTKLADAFDMNMVIVYSPGEKVVKVAFKLRDTIISKSFQERIIQYRDRLFQDCLVKLCRYNKQDAEDLTQDAICDALIYHYRFNETSQMYTWLFKIARNKHAISLRNEKDLIYVNEFFEEGEILEEVKQNVSLTKYINRLSDNAKELYKLRITNTSYADIAKKLNITETGAKSWYWTINKQLRERIKLV